MPLPSHPSDDLTPVIRRPGACFEAQDDRRYALGWPHIRYVVDGHKDEGKSLAKIPKVWARYTRVWPRGIASRFARALGEYEGPQSSVIDPEILKVADHDEPVTADEARALVTRQLATPGRGSVWVVENLLLLLEAMVGAAPLLDAIVEALEALEPARWAPDPAKAHLDRNPGAFALQSGILLLRVPPAEATRQRARLEAVYARVAAADAPRGENQSLTGLDCALHGTEAVVRSLHDQDWHYFHWYTHVDDVELLTSRMNNKQQSSWEPNPRHLYLAGPDLIPVQAQHGGKVDATRVREYVEDVGRFRDPRIVDLVLGFVGKKAAKDVPMTWLRDHAAHATPRLEQLARGTSPPPKKKADAKRAAAQQQVARAVLAEL